MAARSELVLHVPGLEDLLGQAAEGGLALPDPLAQLLSRGIRQSAGGDCPWAAASGLPADLPAAPLSRLAAGRSADPGQVWMCADPVELVPDLAAVWFRGPAGRSLNGPLAKLGDELASLFVEEGIQYSLDHPDRAHLALDRLPRARFTPPWSAVGRRLDEVLPDGPEARRWHRLINETQMLLHHFRDRSGGHASGAGLWFWGAGSLPERAHGPDWIAAGGQRRLEGLARWLDRVSEQAEGHERRPGSGLAAFVPDRSQPPEAVLESLVRRWIGPAWSDLRRGRVRRLALVGDRYCWQSGTLRGWIPRARAQSSWTEADR